MWKQYADLERREGDVWAARVVREDFDEGPPSGGAYWACYFDSHDIGCAWLGGKNSWPVVFLLLRSAYWNRLKVAATLLRVLLHDGGDQAEAIDLHVGSSSHHEAILPLMRDFGFTERNQSRILMLKELQI